MIRSSCNDVSCCYNKAIDNGSRNQRRGEVQPQFSDGDEATGAATPATLPESRAAINFVAGEIKNDVVIATVGTAGQIDIYNQSGTVDLVIDVAGYYTNALEARVATLETLLTGLSRETVDGQDTLRLTNAS